MTKSKKRKIKDEKKRQEKRIKRRIIRRKNDPKPTAVPRHFFGLLEDWAKKCTVGWKNKKCVIYQPIKTPAVKEAIEVWHKCHELFNYDEICCEEKCRLYRYREWIDTFNIQGILCTCDFLIKVLEKDRTKLKRRKHFDRLDAPERLPGNHRRT